MNVIATGSGPAPLHPLHPLHAALVAASVPLFLGALFSDLAYASSFEIQWKNFASWLIAGALVPVGFALLWALVDLVRRGRAVLRYALLLLGAWIVGFIDALVHAKDAWASMPSGLLLSAVAAALAAAATWVGFAAYARGGRP
jgi:uncharacterized membrane protein